MRFVLAALVLAYVLPPGVMAARNHGSSDDTLVADMRPDVVALKLATMEDSWVQRRAEALAGVGSEDISRGEMLMSCEKVSSAVVQGSQGDWRRVTSYMKEVCGQHHVTNSSNATGKVSELQMCEKFATGLLRSMTGDEYYNRLNFDASGFCRRFYLSTVTETAHALREEQKAERARQIAEEAAAEKAQAEKEEKERVAEEKRLAAAKVKADMEAAARAEALKAAEAKAAAEKAAAEKAAEEEKAKAEAEKAAEEEQAKEAAVAKAKEAEETAVANATQTEVAEQVTSNTSATNVTLAADIATADVDAAAEHAEVGKDDGVLTASEDTAADWQEADSIDTADVGDMTKAPLAVLANATFAEANTTIKQANVTTAASNATLNASNVTNATM